MWARERRPRRDLGAIAAPLALAIPGYFSALHELCECVSV
jgi:hypothetical protein